MYAGTGKSNLINMNLKSLIVGVLLFSALKGTGQTREEKEVVAEGKKLYRCEMASRYGIDIFRGRFQEDMSRTDGYFSYDGEKGTVCVFFSKSEPRVAMATITFDSTFSADNAIVDGANRPLTDLETELVNLRQAALQEINADTLFQTYPGTNLNLILLVDGDGKRVYVLTGPLKQGVVIFGNDYRLTFDNQNKVKSKTKLHQHIIKIPFGEVDGKKVLETSHTHLPETDELITATDICTLMLYEKFAGWKQHMVMSWKYLSVWDCEKDQLTVISEKVLNKTVKDQQDKN
jgi:hypothetical protein